MELMPPNMAKNYTYCLQDVFFFPLLADPETLTMKQCINLMLSMFIIEKYIY